MDAPILSEEWQVYPFGIATFLAMLIFTIATSLSNPIYGMSAEAIAQATTTTSGTGNNIYVLYGNDAGTKFCCCPGTQQCGAVCCSWC